MDPITLLNDVYWILSRQVDFMNSPSESLERGNVFASACMILLESCWSCRRAIKHHGDRAYMFVQYLYACVDQYAGGTSISFVHYGCVQLHPQLCTAGWATRLESIGIKKLMIRYLLTVPWYWMWWCKMSALKAICMCMHRSVVCTSMGINYYIPLTYPLFCVFFHFFLTLSYLVVGGLLCKLYPILLSLNVTWFSKIVVKNWLSIKNLE